MQSRFEHLTCENSSSDKGEGVCGGGDVKSFFYVTLSQAVFLPSFPLIAQNTAIDYFSSFYLSGLSIRRI